MPITKCSEINIQVDEEADEEVDEEAFPLVASLLIIVIPMSSTFCFNDREETEWIGNNLGASEHIFHQWKIFS